MKLPTTVMSLLALAIESSSSLANAYSTTNHSRAFTSGSAGRRLLALSSKGNLRDKLFDGYHHQQQQQEKTSQSFISKIFQTSSRDRGSGGGIGNSSRSMQEIGWKLLGDEINADEYYDRAGEAVSINADGMRVAFGAYNNRGGRGHVKVFDYDMDADTWTQVGRTISGLSGDESGSSISLSDAGDVLAIGSPDHSNYLGTTRVYKYDPDLDRWMPLGVDIDGLRRGDKNGDSVNLSGDGKRLALGAKDAGQFLNGYARVYEFNGGNWVQVGQTINGPGFYYGTGSTVALNTDGSRLIVSSDIKPKSNLRLVGGVEVYRYDEATSEWVQMGQSFQGSTYYELFGGGADINSAGDRIAIGVKNHDPVSVGKNAGMVQVFQYDGILDSWVQMGSNIYGVEEKDGFGMSVSIDGDGTRVLAGSALADSDGLENNGEARVFEYDETIDDWVQVGNTIYGECEGDKAGRAVDISRDGRRIVVGAPLNWYYSGHIRIFEASPGHVSDIRPSCYTIAPQPTPTTDAPDPTPSPSITPSIKYVEIKAFGEANIQSDDVAFCSKEDEIRESLVAALEAAADDSTQVFVGDAETNCPTATQRRLQSGDSYYFTFTLQATKTIPDEELNPIDTEMTLEGILEPALETIADEIVDVTGVAAINLEVTNIENPSASPTASPSLLPSSTPTVSPSNSPSAIHSDAPSFHPSKSPSALPSKEPTTSPSAYPTASPSLLPTSTPSISPSNGPSAIHSDVPSFHPSKNPSASPSKEPTTTPSASPNASPSKAPSSNPTALPTNVPTLPPSLGPTASLSQMPTSSPSLSPTESPSRRPTASPSSSRTVSPSKSPTVSPSSNPTVSPTSSPTASPSSSPTESPSRRPTVSPTSSPTVPPTSIPTTPPSSSPTDTPTEIPSVSPTASPTKKPTASPSSNPTDTPTEIPTSTPTDTPTESPSASPTKSPTVSPTQAPISTASSSSTAAGSKFMSTTILVIIVGGVVGMLA